MGATMGADGKWAYNGAPVTPDRIIRTEDDVRSYGDYIATQLETLDLPSTASTRRGPRPRRSGTK